MRIKNILSTSNDKYIIYILIVFLTISLISPILRLKSDIENMKVKVIFEDSKDLEFYDGKTLKNENAIYIVPKDATNINLQGINLKGKKFGILEFNQSENIAKSIAKNLPKDMILRVHYIKPKELERYDEETLFKRLWRAVVERSIDLIVLPRTSLTEKVSTKFKNYFKISEPRSYIPNINIKNVFIIILSVFVILLFPLTIITLPLLYISYEIYVSTISILGTIIIFLKIKDNLLKFFAFFSLGILTNLSLYDFYHVNNIDPYRGVKLSLILLPSILLIKFIINQNKEFKKHIRFLIPIFTVFGIYYIIRSGNFGFVTDFERNIREFIENIFIIRPRTKEILFYPLLFVSPYIKSDFYKKIFEILGSIAYVSTFNTFCHIHTPLFVNVYRELITLFLSLIFFFIIKIIIGRSENKWEKLG